MNSRLRTLLGLSAFVALAISSGGATSTPPWSLSVDSSESNRVDVYHVATFSQSQPAISPSNLVASGLNDLDVTTNLPIGYYIVIPHAERDSDGDGLEDVHEVYMHETNPLKPDTDRDSMPDGWEVQYGVDPKKDDGLEDHDNDGYGNLDEFKLGTHPRNPDTDDDGIWDMQDLTPLEKLYTITIVKPESNAVFYTSEIEVQGSVSPAPASLEILMNDGPIDSHNGVFSGAVSVVSRRGWVAIELNQDGHAVGRARVEFKVDIDPPEFRIRKPVGVVSQANARIVINADGSNYVVLIGGEATHRSGYLYSKWIHMDGTNMEVPLQITDTRGLCTTSSIPLQFALPASFDPNQDSDGDGCVDDIDLFPADKSETSDSDMDGRGDNIEVTDPDPVDGWRSGSLIIRSPPEGHWEK